MRLHGCDKKGERTVGDLDAGFSLLDDTRLEIFWMKPSSEATDISTRTTENCSDLIAITNAKEKL